jgi:hypothetical protein
LYPPSQAEHIKRQSFEEECMSNMASQSFCFHSELAQYCIVDVPGLNVDVCFEYERLSIGANAIKHKIDLWGRMDLHVAAAEIHQCYLSHDYNYHVNSCPQAPLALFSPLLRRLCVFFSTFTIYLIMHAPFSSQ